MFFKQIERRTLTSKHRLWGDLHISSLHSSSYNLLCALCLLSLMGTSNAYNIHFVWQNDYWDLSCAYTRPPWQVRMDAVRFAWKIRMSHFTTFLFGPTSRRCSACGLTSLYPSTLCARLHGHVCCVLNIYKTKKIIHTLKILDKN